MVSNLDRKFRAYTSGKMSGLPDHGFKSFVAAKKKLESQGFEVLSPAENFSGVVVDALRHLYLRRDIEQVLNADLVVVLPGWEDSDGAKLEVRIAQEIGIPILNLDLSEVQETVALSTHSASVGSVYGLSTGVNHLG